MRVVDVLLDAKGEPLGTADVEVDRVPTIDGLPAEPTYPDYTASDTRILGYTVLEDAPPEIAILRPPVVATRAEARALAEEHGQVVEENYVPGRAYFRVIPNREGA